MNREEIIRIAREAGCPVAGIGPMTFDDKQLVSMLERFAALVIANHPPQSFMSWQEGYEAGKQTEREKYEAIITNMTKLLEAQQNREGVAVDMIAAGVAAEREACAKIGDYFHDAEANCGDLIRARGQA